MGIKIISKNRKARHEYQILDKYEAGISLLGTEVKALRAAKVNLGDGWIDVREDRATLCDTHIGHYEHGNIMNHEEKRRRPLLLNKREIIKLNKLVQEKGMTIVPLAIYFKGSFIKLEIGVGRGKNQRDKRQDSKKRDAERSIRRAMKRNS